MFIQDWTDVDNNDVFEFGERQLQYTFFHINQQQPFNSLQVGQPVKSTKGCGRGRGKRKSSEGLCQLSEQSNENPSKTLVRRSLSMPFEHSSPQSISESLDADSDSTAISGASVIITSCDNSNSNQNCSSKKCDNMSLVQANVTDDVFSLDGLVDSMKNISLNCKDSKGISRENPETKEKEPMTPNVSEQKPVWRLDETWTFAKQSDNSINTKETVIDLLDQVPEPLEVDVLLLHNDYPPDIDAIEAELNFMRDGEAGDDVGSSPEEPSIQRYTGRNVSLEYVTCLTSIVI